jgi:hypothetical protein
MLDVVCISDIEYPVEAQDRVEDHCEIVGPSRLVATEIAEKGLFRVGLTEGPVHR